MQNIDFSLAMRRFLRPDFAGDGLRIRTSFSDSAKSLRGTRTLATAGMLLAMQVALSFVATISLGQHIRISFDFLAVAVAGMLLGPVPAMLCAGLSDIIMCLLRPLGPYFPGFTLTALLGGLIYGMAFYRRDIGLFHILLAKLLVNIVVNTLINSVNLHILYGNLSMVLLLQRAVTNLIKLPVDVVMLSLVLTQTQVISRRLGWDTRK